MRNITMEVTNALIAKRYWTTALKKKNPYKIYDKMAYFHLIQTRLRKTDIFPE